MENPKNEMGQTITQKSFSENLQGMMGKTKTGGRKGRKTTGQYEK
jgi:hypothetical protein